MKHSLTAAETPDLSVWKTGEARTLCDTGQLDPFELISQLQADKARLEGWLNTAMFHLRNEARYFVGMPKDACAWWEEYEPNAEVR